MSACSGRSSETACALRAPTPSWATASTLSWTSFSLFHQPAQQHKHDPERDPLNPRNPFYSQTSSQGGDWNQNYSQKNNYPVEHFKWQQMYAGLPWTFLGGGMHVPCAHAEGLRVSHLTLALIARLRLHCSCTTHLRAMASLSPAWEALDRPPCLFKTWQLGYVGKNYCPRHKLNGIN